MLPDVPRPRRRRERHGAAAARGGRTPRPRRTARPAARGGPRPRPGMRRRTGPRPPVDLRRGPRFPDDPPEVWHVPRRNRRFIGRTELLEQMYEALTGAGHDGAVLALRGPGGVGKTQLALEYAHRFAGEYDIVWWITAAQRVTARTQFADLAPELGLRDAGDLAATIKAVRRELDRTARPWLLVLDGAGDPEKVIDLLPEGRGHVLVTTHRSEWAAQGENLQIPGLRTPGEHRLRGAARTARLSTTRPTGSPRPWRTCPCCSTRWRPGWRSTPPCRWTSTSATSATAARTASATWPPGQYPESFEVAWAKLVNTLREGRNPPGSCSTCSSASRPKWCRSGCCRPPGTPTCRAELAELVAEPSSWNSALRQLSEITSMRIEYEAGPAAGHPDRRHPAHAPPLPPLRPVHPVTRGRRTYFAAARKVLVSADPRDSSAPGNWTRYGALIPHLEPSGALDSADDDVARTGPELHRVPADARRVPRRLAAQPQGRGALARAPRATPTAPCSSPSTSSPTCCAGSAGTRRRRRSDARSSGGSNAPTGVRPIEVIRAKDGLGGTLMALGRYAEARALFEEAAASAAAELGGEAGAAHPRHPQQPRRRPRPPGPLHRVARPAPQDLRGPPGVARRTRRPHPQLLAAHRLDAAPARQLPRGAGASRGTTPASTARSWTAPTARPCSPSTTSPCAPAASETCSSRTPCCAACREKLIRRRGALHPETLLVSCDYAMLLRRAGAHGGGQRTWPRPPPCTTPRSSARPPVRVGARDNVASDHA